MALVYIDRKSSTAAHCDLGFEEQYEHRLLVGSTHKKDMYDKYMLHKISPSRIIHEKYEVFTAPDAIFAQRCNAGLATEDGLNFPIWTK